MSPIWNTSNSVQLDTAFFFASGDDGAVLDYVGCARLAPLFPCTSPFVTAVGSTTVEPSGQPMKADLSGMPPVCTNSSYGCQCTTSINEQITNNLNSGSFPSGGGFSGYFPRPSYQDNAVINYIKTNVTLPRANYTNVNNRGYPDIAAVGAVLCNIVGTIPYSCQMEYGTSASTPMIAALFTLLNNDRLNAGKAPLGPVNQLIYKMFDMNSTKYFNNNFLQQNNGNECGTNLGYYNVAGQWSPLAGVGSPKFSAIREYVASLK